MTSPVLLVLLLLVVAQFSSALTSVYVVADNGQECPRDQVCHSLQDIIQQDSYFSSSTELVFLEGEHQLNSEEPVIVKEVVLFALRGVGQWVTGPEETVMQSSVVINCTKGRGGFQFNSSGTIVIEGLTFTHCGSVVDNGGEQYPYHHAAIVMFQVVNVTLIQVSVQNSSFGGFQFNGCINIDISYCSVAYSRGLRSCIDCGNVVITNHKAAGNGLVRIENSNCTKGFGVKGSMTIEYNHSPCNG